MIRTIALDLGDTARKLTHGAFVISVEQMIEPDGYLNQTLQEQPIFPADSVPEVFQRIVTLEEQTVVKFSDSPLELLLHRSSFSITKMEEIFKNPCPKRAQTLKYLASGW